MLQNILFVIHSPLQQCIVSVLDKSDMVYAKDRPISNEDHRKHEIRLFYNATNAGVDTVGQIVRYYSCR